MSFSFRQAKYLLSEVDSKKLPPSKAEVAFVGRSNSGKSSMINALCYPAKIAQVSNTPGRTRTINVFELARAVWLVDLPGYGFATGSAASKEGWRAMIEEYLTGRPSLQAVFMLVDANVGPTALDLQMAEWLVSQKLPFHVLANKVDQVQSSKQLVQRQMIAQSLYTSIDEILWISAKEGTGIPVLRQHITQLLQTAK